MLVIHANLETVLAQVRDNKIAELSADLAQYSNRLSSAGASIGAISAVTPHIALPAMEKLADLPFVNLLEETVREIRKQGIERVAVFGTRFVMESGLFGYLQGLQVVLPVPGEVEAIHNAYVEIARTGCATIESETRLRGLAHTLCERDRVDAIVLAGTELALVFNDTNTDFPTVNCANIHIDAIVHRLL
ncbi:MAG: aspartate/glutamate racemase family protein [Verrucomicrobia bacterium]|nr:aspartate/glutamate racemase family protein [Verrucomicrobiota bacterium]